MDAAAQYLEVLVTGTLLSLGLGLAAAGGIIRVMFGLLGARGLERRTKCMPAHPAPAQAVRRESLGSTT